MQTTDLTALQLIRRMPPRPIRRKPACNMFLIILGPITTVENRSAFAVISLPFMPRRPQSTLAPIAITGIRTTRKKIAAGCVKGLPGLSDRQDQMLYNITAQTLGVDQRSEPGHTR